MGESLKIEKFFNTGEVCKRVGLSPHIIRNWRRQGLGPKPAAITPGGWPLYTEADVVEWYRDFYQVRGYMGDK